MSMPKCIIIVCVSLGLYVAAYVPLYSLIMTGRVDSELVPVIDSIYAPLFFVIEKTIIAEWLYEYRNWWILTFLF